jgi:phosphoribosylanthranilate isomerase
MSIPPHQKPVAHVTRQMGRRQLCGWGLRPSICGVRRTRVKICGITRPEDALAAADAGADAIGMVFYKAAPRCVSNETAAEILRVLPPFVTPVGLFVDATAAEVNETARRLGLRDVQLHGDESPQILAALKGYVVIKAIRVTADGLGAELSKWRQASGLVLETASAGMGGSGVENDWGVIGKHQKAGAFADGPPLIAAGGLTPENVASVLRELRPWAVDVSSGVERVRGQKSVELISDFIVAVREADAAG